MDYSKLSDAEINLAVAAIQFPKSGLNTPYSHRPDVHIYHANGSVEAKDYCSAWSDAGDIIAQQKISIIFDTDSKIEPPARWVMCRNDEIEGAAYIHYEHPNRPLRAAMIVFLMMQESE